MHKQIRKELLNMQNKEYKEFHSKLCPGTDNIIGIKIPVLRTYAKQIFKNPKWDKYVLFDKTKYYEEIMLQGMLIGLAKKNNIQTTLHMAEKFIVKIDNWAVCDVFCAGLKTVKKNKTEVWNFIKKYLNSQKEFELRFAIVIILSYYIDEKYLSDIFRIFDKIKHDGYYVKMAVAWAISNAFVKYPKETMHYLKNNELDTFTYNKALQKITESLRVSKETKEIIKKMKTKDK